MQCASAWRSSFVLLLSTVCCQLQFGFLLLCIILEFQHSVILSFCRSELVDS